MRTSITYRLPGGISATYAGEPMSRFRWLRQTWTGGWALWRIWFRCAGMVVAWGYWPAPWLVGKVTLAVLKRLLGEGRR